MAPRMSIMGLPTDIQIMILDWVIRPTDMVSLCLVCRHFHEIIVRPLYHTVSFDVGSSTDTRLSAFLNPRNIGLPHVRNVELYLADVLDKCNQLQQAHLATRMLLEFLPANILDKFSWHPWQPFSADNLQLLYQKQRKLKWLEAITLDRPLDDSTKAGLKLDVATQHVTKLGLYPDSRDVLELCHEVLVRSKNVQKITLHANFDDVDPPIPPQELNDSPTAIGVLASTIFRHMGPEDRFASCTPMSLKELTLQKINLRYASDSYCRVIDFRTLRHLRVFSCNGTDALFAELCRSTRLPQQLETLEIKHEDDIRESPALVALDGFLCLVTGIRRLTIDLSNTQRLPAAAGISRHANTLRVLNIHACSDDVDDTDEDVYSTEAFTEICKCKDLEQLSLAFPRTSIMQPASEEFAAYTHAMANLRNLVTLNMTTWPTHRVPSANYLPRKMYELLLQGMAQIGFEVFAAEAAKQSPPRPCKLAVIAFGSSDKIYEREESKNCLIYVKGKQIDPFGKESVLAVPVGWSLRKYVESRSDILDVSLARSTPPPIREPPSQDSE